MGSSTLFPAEDKLYEKANYHRWKMSIDLTLENQGVLDHVRGNIVEPPSNASAAAWNKWKNGEVKTIERTHTGTMIKIPLMANQRNDKFNSKGKRRARDRGRGQPFKKARKSRMY
jgi:hypothetical protein